MKVVKKFEENRYKKGKSSIIKDATVYTKHDFNSELITNEDSFIYKYRILDDEETTEDIERVGKVMKAINQKKVMQDTKDASWQGVLFKIRDSDAELVKDQCYSWLSKWKDCPTRVINNIHSIYLQITPTLSFLNYRMPTGNNTYICRLCKQGNETVKHLLSNCQYFLNTAYVRRHDKSLQHVLFKYLYNKGFIGKCPPWYSSVNIRPRYENDKLILEWDIPEYTGYETSDNVRPPRPDGKIILRKEKKVYVIENSIPWVENRKEKYVEKEDKYREVVQSLKADYPGFEVRQLTFIMDCLGGFSSSLKQNLKILEFNENECKAIVYGMQKIVLTEASSIIDRFKIMTATRE